MNSSALVSGCTYYRLTFADPDMTMPGIEPLVYIGRHASEGEMLHTFQDAISYTLVGRYPGPFRPDQDMEVLLYPMKDEEAGAMLSFAEMIAELNEIAARAVQLRFPLLKAPHVVK